MSDKMTFKEINQIDVSEHTEQKMNLTYLSWAWAHAEMKKIDEDAKVDTHEFPDTETLARLASEGTVVTPELAEAITINYRKDSAGAYVRVSVTLNGRTETESLPVMDNRNNAVKKPDATQINKAHKRCFVKALALHGLGLYIYAGEDLPEVATISNQQVTELENKVNEVAKVVDDDNSKEKMTRWLIGKYSTDGNELSDIEADKFTRAIDAMNKMIAKRTDENDTEQTSLMDGNTTTAKENEK